MFRKTSSWPFKAQSVTVFKFYQDRDFRDKIITNIKFEINLCRGLGITCIENLCYLLQPCRPSHWATLPWQPVTMHASWMSMKKQLHLNHNRKCTCKSNPQMCFRPDITRPRSDRMAFTITGETQTLKGHEAHGRVVWQPILE